MKYIIPTLIYLTGLISGVLLHNFGPKLILWVKTLIDNETFQNIWSMWAGIGALVAIIFALYTYSQSERFFKIENRPIPKVIIPQIHDTNISSQQFQIQLHNRGRNPLTDVKMYWKILPLDGNTLLKDEIREDGTIFPIIEQTDFEQVTTNFKCTDLKNPNQGFLFIIVGIKSKDLLEKDIYQIIYYCSLGEKKWWKADEKLYPRLEKEHRDILERELNNIHKKLNQKRLEDF